MGREHVYVTLEMLHLIKLIQTADVDVSGD